MKDSVPADAPFLRPTLGPLAVAPGTIPQKQERHLWAGSPQVMGHLYPTRSTSQLVISRNVTTLAHFRDVWIFGHICASGLAMLPLAEGCRVREAARQSRFLENATARGRAWYKLFDAPVLTLGVTVRGDRSKRESNTAEN